MGNLVVEVPDRRPHYFINPCVRKSFFLQNLSPVGVSCKRAILGLHFPRPSHGNAERQRPQPYREPRARFFYRLPKLRAMSITSLVTPGKNASVYRKVLYLQHLAGSKARTAMEKGLFPRARLKLTTMRRVLAMPLPLLWTIGPRVAISVTIPSLYGFRDR